MVHSLSDLPLVMSFANTLLLSSSGGSDAFPEGEREKGRPSLVMAFANTCLVPVRAEAGIRTIGDGVTPSS
jgi:hypothetical protein